MPSNSAILGYIRLAFLRKCALEQVLNTSIVVDTYLSSARIVLRNNFNGRVVPKGTAKASHTKASLVRRTRPVSEISKRASALRILA